MVALIRVIAKRVARHILKDGMSLNTAIARELQAIERDLGHIPYSAKHSAKKRITTVLAKGVKGSMRGHDIRVVIKGTVVTMKPSGMVYVQPIDDYIPWVHVDSSMMESVAVDGNDLYVRFNTGKVACYIGAGANYGPLLSAESVGKYFNRNIRNAYKWRYL